MLKKEIRLISGIRDVERDWNSGIALWGDNCDPEILQVFAVEEIDAAKAALAKFECQRTKHRWNHYCYWCDESYGLAEVAMDEEGDELTFDIIAIAPYQPTEELCREIVRRTGGWRDSVLEFLDFLAEDWDFADVRANDLWYKFECSKTNEEFAEYLKMLCEEVVATAKDMDEDELPRWATRCLGGSHIEMINLAQKLRQEIRNGEW